MLKTGTFAALALLGALLVNPAFAEDKAAATVNGVPIPQARVDMRVKIATAQGQPDTPALQKAVLDDMINLEVLAQAAEKAGIDKNPEVIPANRTGQGIGAGRCVRAGLCQEPSDQRRSTAAGI